MPRKPTIEQIVKRIPGCRGWKSNQWFEDFLTVGEEMERAGIPLDRIETLLGFAYDAAAANTAPTAPAPAQQATENKENEP